MRGETAGERAGILVVDDRPENLLVVRTILEDLGHDLVTARSGEQALKCLLDRDFAVILLDVNMPGMDGLETATFIRSRQRSLRTPIIFLTAYVEEMHTAKAYALGAVDYMLTPVVPAVLRSKVKVFVDLFLMARQVERQAAQRIAFAREQAARAAAEESARRLGFLTRASDILASSLDVEANMRAMARFVVPYLADLGLLAVLPEYGPAAHAEIAWAGIDDIRHSQTIAKLDDAVILSAMQEALACGNPVDVRLERSCSALAVTRVTDGRAETANLDLGFELRFVVVLPLLARNRRLGALVLGYADREFDAATRALAEDLAARAAVAVDNCLLYAKVQEADQRKNQFLAMLAHELRNPLAPVRNAAQVLRSSQADPAKLEWAANVIDRQSRHLVRLVDDLLDVARITQGKITLSFEPVDVATVVAMAEEMTRQLIESRRHTLAVRIPPEPMSVYGDCARIAQILGNLLNNAAKYSEPGSDIALEVEESGERDRLSRPRFGHRHTGRAPRLHLRSLHPGRPLPRPFAGRPRHRAHDRAQSRAHAGRQRAGRKRGHGQGQRIHGAAAARRPPASRPARCRGRGRVPPPRALRGCVFSSSTTIPTPRKAWRHWCRPRGTSRWSRTTGRRPSRWRAGSSRTWFCSTSDCPG